MVAPSAEALHAPLKAGRNFAAVLAFLLIGGGGFAIAIAAYVVFCEGELLWDPPPGIPILAVFIQGVPLIGLIAAIYGFGFVSAYLSGALGVAAVISAFAVWRWGRLPVSWLLGLLALCPSIVAAQASLLGIRYDPMAETDADALTVIRVLVRFSPLLVPALLSAWLAVERWVLGNVIHGTGKSAMP